MSRSPYYHADKCVYCLNSRESAMHYRICVPPNQWPDSMRVKPPQNLKCDCGYITPSTSKDHIVSLRMHRLHSPIHQPEGVANGTG